ncbi:hypothetical protein J9317_16675 [Metabacillus sp. KIGAM252]|uniref:Uncharacterized protein n=1 Tax=Metabacillus flavus TaxID=2823519 RepID=A0ABS5LIS8_9BACI|nr:hypothetical protein [Metabacillus flavus]MBS2970383.1 hypothetical protein [Metabacillus flavus]
MKMCPFCDKDKEKYKYTASGEVVCYDCIEENDFENCIRCHQILDGDICGEGFCEGCWEYVDTPEWMNDNGGEVEFMDSYDPDIED